MAALLAVGVLSWWWPSFLNWGATTGGLIAIWLMYMLADVAAGRSSVRGNPLHLAILGVAMVVVHHVGVFQVSDQVHKMGGAMDLSMVFCFALLALGIMLAQNLLSRWRFRGVALAVLGALLAVSSAVVSAVPKASPIVQTLTLTGMAGVAIMGLSLSLLAPSLRRRRGGLFLVAILLGLPALGTTIALAIMQPLALLGGGAVVATAMLMLLTFGRRPAGIFTMGRAFYGTLLVLFAGVMTWAAWSHFKPLMQWAGPLGLGEQTLARLSARDSGLVYLAVATGQIGLGWFVLVWAVGMAWLLHRAKRCRPRPVRTALALTAAFLCLGAMLAPGGLFLPAVLLVCSLTWGILPDMIGARLPRRGGWVVVLAAASTLMILGLMNDDSLFMWASFAFGGADGVLHGLAGLSLTMVLLWQLGQRSLKVGLLVALVAISMGGMAELVQKIFGRDAEWSDFLAHSIGGTISLILYLHAYMSRWAESREVTNKMLRLRQHARVD